MTEQTAKKIAHDIIKSMSRYANFRAYWRSTNRKETILENIATVVHAQANKEKPSLDWD